METSVGMVVKKMIPDVYNEHWIKSYTLGKNNFTSSNSHNHEISHKYFAIFVNSSYKMISISYLLRNLD